MAMKCENCGKGIMYGHNVSHAKNRTKRIFKPNLHKVRVAVNGLMMPHFAKASRGRRMKLCTKCLRMYKKKMQEHQVEPIEELKSTSSISSNF